MYEFHTNSFAGLAMLKVDRHRGRKAVNLHFQLPFLDPLDPPILHVALQFLIASSSCPDSHRLPELYHWPHQLPSDLSAPPA